MRVWDRYHPGRAEVVPRYPGTFLLALQEALTALGWQIQRWLSSSVQCTDAEGQPHTVELDNLYRRIRREDRMSWPALLADLLQGARQEKLAPPPADLASAAEHILARLVAPPDRQEGVWQQPLAGEFVAVTLTVDTSEGVAPVTEQLLAESGKSADAWLTQASQNLDARTPERWLVCVHEESGLLRGDVGDGYDAARALLLDRRFPEQAERGFLVTVPGRDHLLVMPVSAAAVAFLPQLRNVAIQAHAELPHAICSEIFWVQRGVWRLFEIDVTGPKPKMTPPPEFLAVLERQGFRGDSPGDELPK